MYTFLHILVIASSLLHATLGCHAHHVHVAEGDKCCASQLKKSSNEHKQIACSHSHKSPTAAEKLSKANADGWHSSTGHQLPGHRCPAGCDGQSCNWWQGPAFDDQQLLFVSLLISPAMLQGDILQRQTPFAVDDSPPSARSPHCRVHLLFQVLLV